MREFLPKKVINVRITLIKINTPEIENQKLLF